MHELVLEFCRDARRPVVLARLPLDDGGLVACFDRTPQPGCDGPRWIAKMAQGPDGCLRLRAEAMALGKLETQSWQLGVPRLLGWRETQGPKLTACLIQAGVQGSRQPCHWRLRRPWAALPEALVAAAAWLQAMQRCVPAPRATNLHALAREAREGLEMERAPDAETELLLATLGRCLGPIPAGDGPPAVSLHGDFWSGNILRHRRGLCVVDWSGWDAGSALEDLLTYMAMVGGGGLVGWRYAWFTPGRPREFLRQWAAEAGYSDQQARLAFYLFLIRRLKWELGLGLQARRPAERAAALRHWVAVAAWLAQHRYPDPFTPMPI